MASKTEAGREKVKVTYLVGDVPVYPVRIGKSMWWVDEANTIRVKKWTHKRLVKIGGRQ